MESENLNKEVLNDLAMGLDSVNRTESEDPTGPVMAGDPVKPKCVLPNFGVKLFCDFKNHIKASALAKNQDEDTKSFIMDRCRTSDKEVQVYKAALEMTGDKYAPPEWIDFMNKYANSPIAIVLEHEIQETMSLRADLKEYLASKKAAS